MKGISSSSSGTRELVLAFPTTLRLVTAYVALPLRASPFRHGELNGAHKAFSIVVIRWRTGPTHRAQQMGHPAAGTAGIGRLLALASGRPPLVSSPAWRAFSPSCAGPPACDGPACHRCRATVRERGRPACLCAPAFHADTAGCGRSPMLVPPGFSCRSCPADTIDDQLHAVPTA
jgi:hypothetical protein